MQTGPLLALAIAAGFGAGAMGGLLFSPTSADSGEPLLSAEAGGNSSGEGYGQKIQALQAENASLEAKVLSMESSIRDLAMRRESVALETADANGAGQPLAETSYSPESAVPYSAEEELRFSAYLDNIEKQRDAERDAERQERRDEAMARRVDRLTEELGLDTYQSSEMKRVLGESETAMRDYWTEMRESGTFDREQMRTDMAAFNEKTNETLGSFLTPQQLEQYQSSNNGGGRFGGFGRGGGDAGGGGGRGGNNGGGGGRGGF